MKKIEDSKPDYLKKGFVPAEICPPKLWEEYKEDPFAFEMKYKNSADKYDNTIKPIKQARRAEWYLNEISQLKEFPLNELIKEVKNQLNELISNKKKFEYTLREEKISIYDSLDEVIDKENNLLEEIRLATEMRDRLNLVDKKFKLKPFISFLSKNRY